MTSVLPQAAPVTEMREPTFFVLTALASGPQHGWAVMQSVEQLSGGRVRLRPGTLYGALDRLCDEGLVERGHEEVVDGRARRYYSLSEAGVNALRDEVARLSANIQVARRGLRALGATL